MEEKGFDLSIYQKGINYDKLAEEGKFVILKIGEADFKDKEFDTHYCECLKRGLKIGGYYFSRALTVEDAKKEAKNCLKFLSQRNLHLPIYFDVETNAHMKLGKAKLTEIVKAFCDTINNDSSYKSGLYTNPNFMENYLYKDDLMDEDISIWLAHWTENPDIKSRYKYDQDCWQWGITKIDGMKVDADIWLKSLPVKEYFTVVASKEVAGISQAQALAKNLNEQGMTAQIYKSWQY